MRVLIDEQPFANLYTNKHPLDNGLWNCSWVTCPDADRVPIVAAYRLQFEMPEDTTIRLHVSADERYDLFLDGMLVGRGSERGDAEHWAFDTYDVLFTRGKHVMVARVWSLGKLAPVAQMSVEHSFLCAPDDSAWDTVFGTGLAAWHCKRLGGYLFHAIEGHLNGSVCSIDGKYFDWGFEHGHGDDWWPVIAQERAADHSPWYRDVIRHLVPASLPPMIQQPVSGITVRSVEKLSCLGERATQPIQTQNNLPEHDLWQALLDSQAAITIPASSTWRIILDLEDYYCGYSKIVVSGGQESQIILSWAESLYDDLSTGAKGNRNTIDEKFFMGFGDQFRLDGGQCRHFAPHWWRAGRYLEIAIQTSEHPVIVHSCTIEETRYPLEMQGAFTCDDHRIQTILPMLKRGLQMCAHETYMDCPYYEQLMYTGDTRLELLTHYVINSDDRLPRKAISLFDWGRHASGLTRCRYPSHKDHQLIAPFGLWWIGMVHDYAYWRDDLDFVRKLMPGIRATLHFFQNHLNADGLLTAPQGWNFMDTVPTWTVGIPPDGISGCSGVLHWHYVYVLTLAADLEQIIGDPLLYEWTHAQAQSAARSGEAFWDDQQGLYADDLKKHHFSEHIQCMALLSGLIPPEHQERTATNLIHFPFEARATIYFSHYLFETYRRIGRIDQLMDRLDLWFKLANSGLKTPIEAPEPNRSDCHAWGSHPLFHLYATILGIRPGSPGFSSVLIQPQLNSLTSVRGTLPHPKGEITVEINVTPNDTNYHINLPPDTSGKLIIDENEYPLTEHEHTLTFPYT